MPRSFRFSVLRLTPDVRRGEVINVGLVVFGPSGVEVRVLPSLSKAQAVDGTLDPATFFEIAKRIPRYLGGVAGIEQQIEALNDLGLVTASAPGEFAARDEAAYELAIADLMRKLVIPPRKRSARLRDTRISADIRRRLRASKILGASLSDIDNHLIVPNFPISEQLELFADFAVKNGVMNLVKTIDLRTKNASSEEKFREACSVSFLNIKAQQRYSDARRFVVYAAEQSSERSIARHIDVLSDDAEFVLDYENPRQRAFLLSEVALAASGPGVLAH